jgi:polyphosphate kinase 2 (PPK2 family)
LSKCSTEWAPWHLVPADHKWYRNLVVAEAIVKTLEDLKLQYPPPKLDLSQIVLE